MALIISPRWCPRDNPKTIPLALGFQCGAPAPTKCGINNIPLLPTLEWLASLFRISYTLEFFF